MDIKSKVKKFFAPVDGKDLGRRKFIKDAAGLAALTVVAGAIPSILVVDELKRQIESGVVRDQIFYISETVVIDIPNVKIVGCKFIATAPMKYMIEMGVNAKQCLLMDCVIDANGFVCTGIMVHAQQGDMTQTMQSAFNTNAHTVHLSAGTHNISSPITMPSNLTIKGDC